MDQRIAKGIKKAVEANKHQYAVEAARAMLQQAAEKAQQVAANLGVPIYVKVNAGRDDGSIVWPTTLAGTLCEQPALASGTREEIAKLLTVVMELDPPFEATRLSKPLSIPAKKHVAVLLNKYGYAWSTLSNGVSIRNIVKRDIRSDLDDGFRSSIHTQFFVDRVVMDGNTYRYKQRDRVPTGCPWHDLALRFSVQASGVDMPLLYLLKLRNIGLGEFIAADEKARAAASPDELRVRASLDRLPVTSQRTQRLLTASIAVAETTSNKRPDRGRLTPVWGTEIYGIG